MKTVTLFNELKKYSLPDWCAYLFAGEPLRNKITADQQKELINGAVNCGQQFADEMRDQYGTIDAAQLADKLCKVTHVDVPPIVNPVLLASLTEPNDLKVFDQPIQELVNLELPDFTKRVILNIVMGYELFHFLEGQHPDAFPQTAKVDLWHVGSYHHRFTVTVVSEIAAMAFYWRLNRLSYSPLVLNILLLQKYAHDQVDSHLERLRKTINVDKQSKHEQIVVR